MFVMIGDRKISIEDPEKRVYLHFLGKKLIISWFKKRIATFLEAYSMTYLVKIFILPKEISGSF